MKSLRVLLIQPSYKHCVQSLFSIYNTDDGIGFKPPLGLLYIATALKKAMDCSVKILDCQLDDTDNNNIAEKIKDNYDIVGISVWTDFWFQASAIGKRIKEIFQDVFIVLGGPHINIFPDEILKFDFVDAIVLGDGEIPMIEIVKNFSKLKKEMVDIPGVYFRKSKNENYISYVCNELESLAIPDRTMLPIKKYTSVLSSNKYVTTMITSRGCPFSCVYCKIKCQKAVSRSTEDVVCEFEEISKLGIEEVEVYDDTFNWNYERTIEICKSIVEKGIKLKWAIRDRVDRVREDVLDYLKKAGCYRIHLGIETGSDKVMKNIKKGITLEQARNAVKLAKKKKFVTLTYFMYGLPGETLSDVKQTLKFALELDSDYVEFSIMIPYPGTESYENALRTGIIKNDYWLDFTRNPVPSFKIPQVIENLISRDDLIRFRDYSIKKYYFRPQYILNELLKLKNFGEFKRKIKMGLGLLNLIEGKSIR